MKQRPHDAVKRNPRRFAAVQLECLPSAPTVKTVANSHRDGQERNIFPAGSNTYENATTCGAMPRPM